MGPTNDDGNHNADDTKQEQQQQDQEEFQSILAAAEEHVRGERLLRAARVLSQLPASHRTPRHEEILAMAADFEHAIADLIQDPMKQQQQDDDDDGPAWKKQGETHGKRDALIFYKVDDQARLTCRIETAIEASLLVPILSVLNESDLYATWIPSWTMPKMGLDSSEQLEQSSRGTQTIRILANVPWPYTKREALIKAVAVDEIDERGFVAIRITSNVPVGGVVPPPNPRIAERIDFEGAMLLRPCPRHHELLLKSKHVYREPVILVSFKMFADPRMTGIPTALINFITRTVIGTIWAMFLSVGEDVRNGNRPQHEQAIAEKKDFYDWMAVRIGILLEKAAVQDPLPRTTVAPNKSPSEAIDLEAHKAFISYLQS